MATRTTTKQAKTTPKKATKAKREAVSTENKKETVLPSNASSLASRGKDIVTQIRKTNSFIIFLSLVILAIIAVFFLKKNWFVAAQVGNTYVTNLELQERLNQEYRKSVLDELVDEKIIENEAKTKGVSISESDIDAKIADYETQFGGPDQLDAALQQKGLNRETMRSRVKTELLLTKMYGNDISVSDKEISDYITVNKAVLQATDEAGQKAEAAENIKSQKLFTIVSQKFQELKDAAKVTTF